MVVISNYMDFDDYQTPIKRLYDDRMSLALTPNSNLVKQKDIFLKRNFATLNDNVMNMGSIFSNGIVQEETFYNIADTQYDISEPLGDRTLAFYRLVVDFQEDYYQRDVYTFLDMTGQIGGVFQIFDIIGVFIIGTVANRLFLFSIISKLYLIKRSDSSDKLNSIKNKLFKVDENMIKIKPESSKTKIVEENKYEDNQNEDVSF